MDRRRRINRLRVVGIGRVAKAADKKSNYSSKSYRQLQKIAKKKGLSAGGNYDAILQRLEVA